MFLPPKCLTTLKTCQSHKKRQEKVHKQEQDRKQSEAGEPSCKLASDSCKPIKLYKGERAPEEGRETH